MRITLLLLICLLSTHATFGQQLPTVISESDFSIGKTIRLQSAVLNEERTLNVYLPLSYTTDSLKQYPIIYLLDGSQDEDFIHIAGLVQFGSFPWINMLPESIVVGIGNVDRKRDYTYPSQSALDREEFPTSGKSAAFMTFIEKELKPYRFIRIHRGALLNLSYLDNINFNASSVILQDKTEIPVSKSGEQLLKREIKDLAIS